MELDRIIITGARQHNLKNVTVEIPKKKLVILTGRLGLRASRAWPSTRSTRRASAATSRA